MIFVCATDEVIGCSKPEYGSYKRLQSRMRLARDATFEDTQLVEGMTKVDQRFEERWNAVSLRPGPSNFKVLHLRDGGSKYSMKPREYNKLILAMYDTNVAPETAPLHKQFGFNHLEENGRAFRGSGSNMLLVMSRCARCRFVYHWNMTRVGAPRATGDVDPEDPRKTGLAAHVGLVCAECQCHYRCVKFHKRTKGMPGHPYALPRVPFYTYNG